MNIVFLDIDGVLNRPTARTTALDRRCVAALNTILAASGARVVVSSDWRKHYTLARIAATLAESGFRGDIIARTPVLPGAQRGEEIRTWLHVSSTPEAFVILDDRDDMSDLGRHLVRTDANCGLTDADATRALRILHTKTGAPSARAGKLVRRGSMNTIAR